MKILTQNELNNLLGLESKGGKNDMIQKHYICFDIGSKVSDKTAFYDKLVGLFGRGGTVSRDRSEKVIDFKILTDYGTLELDWDLEALQLSMKCSDDGIILTGDDIQALYDKLKDASIICSDKCWYIKSVNVHEI